MNDYYISEDGVSEANEVLYFDPVEIKGEQAETPQKNKSIVPVLALIAGFFIASRIM